MGGDDAQNKQTECRGVINAFSDTLPVLDLATWRHVDGHHALRERVRPENGRAKRRGPHPLAGSVFAFDDERGWLDEGYRGRSKGRRLSWEGEI